MIVKKSGNKLTFIAENYHLSFINSLRRIIISEVPVLAIEDVLFSKNTSSLYDEEIALRLGLIPLKTDLKSYIPREECDCADGCSRCTVAYTLSKEGPCKVYSGDLIPTDPNCPPVKDDILLLELFSGEELILEARAQLGVGKVHAKWQPVSACGYKYYPTIEISDECDGCGDCVEACPRQILEIKDEKVHVKNIEECRLCRSCVDACEIKAINVYGNPNKIIFKFESLGQLEPEEIIYKALEIFKKKCEDFRAGVAELVKGAGLRKTRSKRRKA